MLLSFCQKPFNQAYLQSSSYALPYYSKLIMVLNTVEEYKNIFINTPMKKN